MAVRLPPGEWADHERLRIDLRRTLGGAFDALSAEGANLPIEGALELAMGLEPVKRET
jgi:hypothetical protein